MNLLDVVTLVNLDTVAGELAVLQAGGVGTSSFRIDGGVLTAWPCHRLLDGLTKSGASGNPEGQLG